MEPEFYSRHTDKEKIYQEFLPQLQSLIEGVPHRVSILANTASALRQAFGHFWVGFYLTDGSDTLHVGPFQGDVACYQIRKGRGVCGTAWQEARTVLVPDVDLFPGHIACSGQSRSEIVVPLFSPDHSQIYGVLDIDSDRLAAFDETDRIHLEKLAEILGQALSKAR